jgi:hypothetical protein
MALDWGFLPFQQSNVLKKQEFHPREKNRRRCGHGTNSVHV